MESYILVTDVVKLHFKPYNLNRMTPKWEQTSQLTRSANPPGTIVLTTTPLDFPPTIPKPNPEPSLMSSTSSIWPQ